MCPNVYMQDMPSSEGGQKGASGANAKNVDMLEQARIAQFTKDAFKGSDFVRLISPAKVNLFLDVRDKREDGKHKLLTVFHALALHDMVYMQRTPIIRPEDIPKDGYEPAGPDGNVLVKVDMVDKVFDPISASLGADDGLHAEDSSSSACSCCDMRMGTKDNLIYKAMDLLATTLGYESPERIYVRVEKRIPIQGGLGGGSSNAAAAIVGAARFWGESESGKTLHEVASKIGADVPFFLRGGCQLCGGIGEVHLHELSPMTEPLLLVKPNSGVSTKAAYEALDLNPCMAPSGLQAQVMDASMAQGVPLFNSFEQTVYRENPQMSDIRDWMLAQSSAIMPDGVLLCGSGATTFARTFTSSDARRLAADAKAKGHWAQSTSFSSLGATVAEYGKAAR